jgi:hypothetical protein
MSITYPRHSSHAYDTGHDPAQTEGTRDAELTLLQALNYSVAQYAELCRLLHNLCDFLQQTGVGAFPASNSQQSTWDESAATAAAHNSYTRRNRIQENAVVVVNLLGPHI